MVLIWRRPASGQEDGHGAALPSVRCSGSHRTAPAHAQEGRPREATGKGHPVRTTHAQLEARLTAVETALRAIQRRLATLRPAPPWLDAMSGSCKDDPAFAEVMAFGRAFREAQPYPDDPGAPA